MGGIFSLDGPLMRALGRIADMILLSVLWIVCSIPFVTIGASTTALYTMTLGMVRGEDGKLSAGFLKAFKENFKQATVIHLILTVLAVFFCVYFQIVSVLPGQMKQIFRVVTVLFCFIWLMEMLFVYPVQARFENTLGKTMKNAWLIAASHVPVLLGVIVISALPVWTLLLNTTFFFRMLPLWIFLAPGLIAWLNSFLFQRCFRRYIPEEDENQMAEEV